MHTSPIRNTAHTSHETLGRVQKIVLAVAAILSLAAIIEHHPGLVALIAAVTMLVQIAVERISHPPQAQPSVDAPRSFRTTDGGSFRADSTSEEVSRTRQGVIVMDGGSK